MHLSRSLAHPGMYDKLQSIRYPEYLLWFHNKPSYPSLFYFRTLGLQTLCFHFHNCLIHEFALNFIQIYLDFSDHFYRNLS